jgi:hypothetical protein
MQFSDLKIKIGLRDRSRIFSPQIYMVEQGKQELFLGGTKRNNSDLSEKQLKH